jgi:hypothetical protein
MNLARSPHIIEISESGQTGSKIELYLGSDIGTPNPTYTLSKLIPASNKIETYYNISPYIREYFNFTKWQNATGLTYNQDTSTDYIVDYELKKFKSVSGVYSQVGSTITGTFSDGFGYYEDGFNPAAPSVLLDEGTYFYNYDASISTAQNNGVWGSFDVQMSIGESIRYTDLSDGSQITYVAASDGVKSFARVYLTYAPNGNKVEYIVGGTTRWTGYFKPQCEPKYQPVTVDFVNRYGSWSRIFFQKAKKRSINVKANEYKFNPNTIPYISQDVRQIQEFNINATETIKLNTGWVNDGYAEVLQQLMLSEKVLLCDYENNTDYAPVKVKTKSLQKQTGLNNGMMNYTLDFDFAYDMINNVM